MREIMVVKLVIVALVVHMLSGCAQYELCQQEESCAASTASQSPAKEIASQTQYGSETETTGILTVPEYIELLNIGDTYQIVPETTNIASPVFSFTSECQGVVSVSDEGLITAEGWGIFRVWVICRDGVSNKPYDSEILVVAGPIVVEKEYE